MDSSARQEFARKRMPQLDVLRAIAVLAVIGFHLPQTPPHFPSWYKASFGVVKTVGWMGVDLFFVLSGFLVSGLIFVEYQKTGQVRLVRFLVRRGFKIYPAYYVFVGLGLLIAPLNGRWLALLRELLFIQNYGPGLWGHTWSLAIEEHFYLGLGILLFLFSRKSTQTAMSRVVPVVGVVCVLCTSLRLLTYELAPTYVSHQPTHLRLDSLAFGVLLSYFFHFHRGRLARICQTRYRLLLSVGALASIGAAAYDYPNWWFYTLGPSALYLSLGVLLLGAIHAPASEARWSNWLANLGFYSYSIYLWHMPMNRLVAKYAPDLLGQGVPLWVLFAIYPVLSVVVGIAMAKLVEVPFIKIRDRHFPSVLSKRYNSNSE